MTTFGHRSERYDAIVVGARVAGASTAILLARRGLRVLLVDRRRPGTDTLSTHALMRAGVLQLQRWGLLDRVKASGAPAITKTTFHYGSEVQPIAIEPSAGVEALYAPRRFVLDSILVAAAEEAGVETRFGTAVEGLVRDGSGRVTGISGRASSGTAFRAAAPVTIGADGIRSLVARDAGAAVEHQGTAASAILYAYWSGPIADGYEFFYRPGRSAGLIPTNGGETCVWVGAPREEFMAELRRDLDGSFHRLLAEAAPEAAARLASAGRSASRVSGFPGEPGFLRTASGPGWALVGDASHFKDPLSAHGITDALRDAELLADAVAATGSGISAEQALREYGRERDRLSLPLHQVSDELAAYRWDLTGVRGLLLAMSKAMKPEVAALLSLDRERARTAA